MAKRKVCRDSVLECGRPLPLFDMANSNDVALGFRAGPRLGTARRTWWWARFHFTGASISTLVPAPGALSRLKRPPICFSRFFILVRPLPEECEPLEVN